MSRELITLNPAVGKPCVFGPRDRSVCWLFGRTRRRRCRWCSLGKSEGGVKSLPFNTPGLERKALADARRMNGGQRWNGARWVAS